MKKSSVGLPVVLLMLLLAVAFYSYHLQQRHNELQQLNQQLSDQLAQTQAQLTAANKKNEALERKSVEGILRETNKVVVSGWETLLDTVEKELNKAKDLIQKPKKTTPDNTDTMPDDAVPEVQGERT